MKYMVNTNNAQEWLNRTIHQTRRQSVIYIFPEGFETSGYDLEEHNILYVPRYPLLEGELDLSDFTSVKTIKIEGHLITKLNLTGCQQLRILKAENNQLRKVIWPQYNDNQISPLVIIDLTNNDFAARNLSEFSRFVNLADLSLGTDDRVKISQNIYNRWNGSLEPLQNLHKLMVLNISGTDIDSGVEYLSVKEFSCFAFGNSGRTGAGVNAIQLYLKRVLGLLIEGSELNDWANNEGDYNDENLAYEKVGDICNWIENYRITEQTRLLVQTMQAHLPR